MSINQDKLGFESNIVSGPKDVIKNDRKYKVKKSF